MFQAIKFVAKTKPKFVLYENVQGMMVATGKDGNGKSPAQLVQAEMAKCGYRGKIVKVDLQLFHRVTRQRSFKLVQRRMCRAVQCSK